MWRIGARLPLVQGTSFAAVASMLAIGKDAGGGAAGLTAIFGAVLVAGVVGFLLTPVFNRLLHFFPPVVTGVDHHRDRDIAAAGGGRAGRPAAPARRALRLARRTSAWPG